MSITIQKTPNEAEGGRRLAAMIAAALNEEKSVLWLISGGSSIPIAAFCADELRKLDHGKLHVTLVDEKITSGQDASNWDKLLGSGFSLPEAALIPIISTNPDDADVARVFEEKLAAEFEWADSAIGQFGIGEGFHTGGIVTGSPAVGSNKLVEDYVDSKDARHITITLKTIRMLSDSFINSFGESKRELVGHFLNSDASVEAEPTQVFKDVAHAVLCSDIAGEPS